MDESINSPRGINTGVSNTRLNTAQTSKQIELPTGGGAIRGITEKFSANPVTGSASLSIPLPISPARGFQPDLALSYDSARGNTAFGLGWDVGVPAISRKTEKRLPTYQDAVDDWALTFQLDFKDERYLPFERAGVISSWKLNLPKPELAQFDYPSISDVLVQINYTARDGGEDYRAAVQESLINNLNMVYGSDTGIPQILSLKQHFPDQWSRLQELTEDAEKIVELAVSLQQLPYFIRRRVANINQQKIMLLKKEGVTDDFAGDISML